MLWNYNQNVYTKEMEPVQRNERGYGSDFILNSSFKEMYLSSWMNKIVSSLNWIELNQKKKTHLSSLFISISTALKILDVTIKELIRFSCLISKYNPINSNFLMAQTKKFKGDEKQMKLDIKRRGVG